MEKSNCTTPRVFLLMRMMSHSKSLESSFYIQFLRSSVMMDGVPSKVNVLLRKVSNPGLVFLEGVQSWVSVLFMEGVLSWVSVLFMEGVLSWSRHQKLQEDWMGTQVISISSCLLSLFTGIPLLGATGRNPGHSTKNCKRIGWVHK